MKQLCSCESDTMNVILDIETTGLSPLDDRITAIGVKTETESNVFMDSDEKVMLGDFWAWLSAINNPIIIGYNVFAFDIKFLALRSMKHDVEVPVYLKHNWLDLQYELAFYRDKYVKLDEYLKFAGLGNKNGTGLQAIKLWKEQKFDELKAYCKQDVELTYELYKRCKKCGIV